VTVMTRQEVSQVLLLARLLVLQSKRLLLASNERRFRLREGKVLRETGERLVRELRSDAEHERERLLEAARQSVERIRKDAQLLGAQESEQAARRIREEVAAQVVSQAVAKLREQLTPADEERFAHEFVSAVESGAAR